MHQQRTSTQETQQEHYRRNHQQLLPRMTRTKNMVQKVWRQADAVCFDVDSTLITEEGIDGLADFCGAGTLVKEWTKKAMGGAVTFQEALRVRLEIIHPSLQQMTQFSNSKKPADILTPGIQDLVGLLHQYGTTVYLVSGGFRTFIQPLADFLDIPRENIFANRILFNDRGEYSRFDEAEPTSRSGGKPRVLEQLKKKHNKIVMIGDGMTDMEASPPADAFIGFGGNVVREKVKASAVWYVYNIQELIDELEKGSSSRGIEVVGEATFQVASKDYESLRRVGLGSSSALASRRVGLGSSSALASRRVGLGTTPTLTAS